MSKNTENAVEFLVGDSTCTVTFTNQKHVNRIKKLYAKDKESFSYFVENADGSICAKIPLSWLRIMPPKKLDLSEDERQLFRERLAKNMGRM